MRILFDQGTPVPLKNYLSGHTVETVFELGWSTLENGVLLARAEVSFDLFITTDQQLRYQQNLAGQKLAILVVMTASWPLMRTIAPRIAEAVERIRPGDYIQVTLS
jgi:hypothetical protein